MCLLVYKFHSLTVLMHGFTLGVPAFECAEVDDGCLAHVVLGFWLSEEVETELCCSFRRRCRGFTGRAMANNTQPIWTEKYQDLKQRKEKKRVREK